MADHKKNFLDGMRDGIPIALGYFAVSFTLGIACRNIGLSALHSTVMSFTNLTSAGEFAALGIMAAGASYWEMALSQLVINLRYMLMSCSLSQKMAPDTPMYHRLLVGYGVTDEIFGISVNVPGRLDPFYVYGAVSIASPAWALGTLFGVVLGNVLPARIVGVKQPTGAVCELLLLRQVKGDQWECLAKPGKRMHPGNLITFGDGTLTAVVDDTLEDGNKLVTFHYDTETLYEKLDAFGKMPLPPYLTKQLEDQSQYQTVYAKELGSAAAPTAGLHFTPELMDAIRAKGVGIAEVTLHVGLGTFRPVQEDEITDHKMHSEWYSISEETAGQIRKAKAAGRRVIAVGTTSCRTLEAVAAQYGEIKACSGNTSIFLYPGVPFRCIDGLITNFHLPESTLIMLVSAFYGYDVEEKYRFFSFGDATLIL